MSSSEPYYVFDDEEDVVDLSDSDVEILDYDSDSSDLSVRSVESGVALVTSTSSRSKDHTTEKQRNINGIRAVSSPDVELQKYRLSKDSTIVVGDTVELVDRSNQHPDAMHSGDFVRVKHIIMDLSTAEVRIRGLLLRRTKYLGQVFDWKLNELAMVLRVDEDDIRSPFLVGMEDFSVDQVLRKRDCILTNKAFPFQSFRNEASFLRIPRSTSKQDAVRRIFNEGRLCCRAVYIRIVRSTGKDASGVVRHLYSEEVDKTGSMSPSRVLGLSRGSSLVIEDEDIADKVPLRSKRARSASVEILESLPPKRKPLLPVKHCGYTFADCFCGAGGASQGASQAGLDVRWGFDNDEDALDAYRLNHPGALPFYRNAHRFPPTGYTTSHLRVDILHLSPPCCYWSPAHTHDGQNDQANYEAIYTVGPILEAVKPRIATLEQTFGLMTHAQHQKNFKLLLNDIGKAGYDLRYKLQDMSRLGLVQKRKRLLIIAARRGTPLPPFPEDTHGEPGSGLKPFVLIDDALKVMGRLGPRAPDDEYHQPKTMATPKPAYDPHTFLKGCITTSGGDNYHYEGKRRYTAREMSLFQSFPYQYQFSGRPTQAMKQVGNAFPPVIAEVMYRSIIRTLQAFDEGLIGAEDDLTDLDSVFAQLHVNSSSAPSTPSSFFETNSRPFRPQHRDSSSESVMFLGRKFASQPKRSKSNRAATPPDRSLSYGLLDGSSDASRVRDVIALDQDVSYIDETDSDDDDVVFLGSSQRSD